MRSFFGYSSSSAVLLSVELARDRLAAGADRREQRNPRRLRARRRRRSRRGRSPPRRCAARSRARRQALELGPRRRAPSRAHASAVAGVDSGRCAIAAATCSIGGGSNRTCWQRERIVGSTSATRSVIRIRCTNGAGSSSVLSIRLAASSPSSSTRSITNTRRADSNGVLLAAATTGPSMSLTRISCAPLGDTQVRSGWDPDRARARALSGSVDPSLSSSAATARATERLPAPPGSVKQVRVRWPTAGCQRRAQQGPRVRMSVEFGQHRLSGSDGTRRS